MSSSKHIDARCPADWASGMLSGASHSARLGASKEGVSNGNRTRNPRSHSPVTLGRNESAPRTKEYTAWTNMVRRCVDDDSPNYRFYGGRGIAVCARWRDSYAAFLADLGRAPTKGHTLGRVEGNGNYEPDNVRWQTWDEQRERHCSVCGEQGHYRTSCQKSPGLPVKSGLHAPFNPHQGARA